MDDGAKITELMLRASIESKLFMLKMIRNALALLIKHLEYLKANNLKPAWRSLIDKTQIKVVQAFTRTITNIKQNVEQEIKDEQRKFDEFTLDKKYELEQYQIKIDKTQRAYEIERDKKNSSPEKLKELQIEIDAARDNKREFEYRTNKECMEKSYKIELAKSELKKLDYDLKICNAKLNALHSNKNIATGRLNDEFEQLLERMGNDIDKSLHEVKETDISLEKFNKAYNDTIKISLDNNLENIENKEHYEDIENKIDLMMNFEEDLNINRDILKNEEKDNIDKILDADDNKEKESNDKVKDMFSKEPEMLEEYKNFENDANFKFTGLSNEKNKDSSINI